MSKRSVRRPIVGSGMKETTLSCESDELHLEAIIDHANSTKPFHGFENFHQWHAEFHHNVCDAESTAPVDAHLTMNQHFPAIFSGVFDDGLRFGKMLQNVVVVIVFSVEGMIHPDIGFVNIDIWIVDGPARTVDDVGDAKTFQSLDVLGFAVAPKKEVLSEHGGAVPNHPYRILGQELLYPTGEHWIFCNRHHLLNWKDMGNKIGIKMEIRFLCHIYILGKAREEKGRKIMLGNGAIIIYTKLIPLLWRVSEYIEDISFNMKYYNIG